MTEGKREGTKERRRGKGGRWEDGNVGGKDRRNGGKGGGMGGRKEEEGRAQAGGRER